MATALKPKQPDPIAEWAQATHHRKVAQHLANLGAVGNAMNMTYTVSEPLSMSYSAGDLTR